GELGQRPALRHFVQAQRTFVLVPERVDRRHRDHGDKDQADDKRVTVPQSIESGPVTSALRNWLTNRFSESNSSSLGPDSTILPFQSTAMKSETRRAVLRSWLITREEPAVSSFHSPTQCASRPARPGA